MSSFFEWNCQKNLSQILEKGISLKNKNCIKVSKIFREWGML
ncbi:Zinc metalloproteinase precursor / aureolysin [Bacillus cereus]|uniref:Zinc metalloproteinase / aureolysin n=1 Tax=Bacillus cereus TaxID=1396 RepID=A0A164GQS8_BACCE|nr:Zinc metalloproteinase precursor / aureolysin [Bacillus cereus]